jgi:hypothetical protein
LFSSCTSGRSTNTTDRHNITEIFLKVPLNTKTPTQIRKYVLLQFVSVRKAFKYSIFNFICMFCRSLFVLLYFFYWPLCCVCSLIYGFW